MTSPLKWIGSKRQQSPRLVKLMRPLLKEGSTYFEPFAGSLAPFFALRQAGWLGTAVLGDISRPLIHFWRELFSDHHRLWIYCRALLDEEQNADSKEVLYNQYKTQFNEDGELSTSHRAALFLYINQRGFNGLWRTNKEGKCTTAYGGPRKAFPIKETLGIASELLNKTVIHHGDFDELLWRAHPGDVVYCDPPYNGTYTGYSGTFGTYDQQRLASSLKSLHQRGVHIFASNSDTPAIRAIYHWAKIEPIEVTYAVKGGNRRVSAKEVLIKAVAQ